MRPLLKLPFVLKKRIFGMIDSLPIDINGYTFSGKKFDKKRSEAIQN